MTEELNATRGLAEARGILIEEAVIEHDDRSDEERGDLFRAAIDYALAHHEHVRAEAITGARKQLIMKASEGAGVDEAAIHLARLLQSAPDRASAAATFAEYEDKTARTRGQLGYRNASLNAALGLAGEAGEAVEIIKKMVFHGVSTDPEDLIVELGDVLFYVAWLAALNNASLEDVARANIDKLQERYPDGFETGGGRRGPPRRNP